MQYSQRNYRNYSYHKDQRLERAVKKPKPGRSRFFIPVAGSLVVGLLAAIIMAFGANKDGKSIVLSAANNESTEQMQKKIVDLSTLQPEIDRVIKKYPYDTSVSVVEINTGKVVRSGDNLPYLAASTTKLLTALYYFENVEAGNATLTEKINGTDAQTLLYRMINKSDNDAWHTLNDRLDRTKMQEYAKENGLSSYDPSNNVVTSADMAQLIAKLYNRDLINKPHTDLLFSWMQNTSEEDYIPPAVPSNMKLYHKAGYLNDRAHDVAIIDNGSSPYVLVIYSKSYTQSYDFTLGNKMFSEITKLTLNKFNQ